MTINVRFQPWEKKIPPAPEGSKVFTCRKPLIVCTELHSIFISFTHQQNVFRTLLLDKPFTGKKIQLALIWKFNVHMTVFIFEPGTFSSTLVKGYSNAAPFEKIEYIY